MPVAAQGGEALAIIPARGGSKRVPRKNIRPCLGRPILARVIDHAREAGCFAEVMVSTEDAEIAALARGHGAAVPFPRSERNAADDAGTAAVLEEVLAQYEQRGRRFAYVCCLYATAVFATPALLRQGFELLRASGAESVVPVLRFSTPVERALRINDGRLRFAQPEHAETRTSELPDAYGDAGQFYWLAAAAFRAHGRIFAADTVPMVLDGMQAQDIDSEEDWRVAEFKYAYLSSR